MSLTSVFTNGPVPSRLAPLSGEDPRTVGPYRLVGRIGAGGMGSVYAAADSTGACVAVKVVHSEHAADPEYRARFAREVDLLRRVRGACTTAVLAADTSSGTPWLAAEYVPGKTLREHVRDEGPLEGGMLRALAAGIAEALVAVHAAGIVHRDLKPGNVILSPAGPKVLDFGIARAADETAITATGMLVGTPGWIPPELYQGAEPDSRADMFAWGGLVAFAATGRSPYGTGSADILAFKAMEERPDLDGVPGDLLPLVERAMSGDPHQRPTAEQALRDVNSMWARGRLAAPAGAAEEELTLTRLLESEWSGLAPPEMARPSTGAPKALVALAAAASVVFAGTGGYMAHTYLDEGRPLVPGSGQAADGGGADQGGAGQGGSEGGGAADQGGSGNGQGSERSQVNGTQITAIDGDDTFVMADQEQELVSWAIQMTDAQAEDGGVRFTALAGFQGIRTAQLVADQFAVSANGQDHPAQEESLTGFLSAFDGTDTVSFLVPDAPESGRLTVHGVNYSEGMEGAPPMGLCYEVGGEFSADTEGCN